MLHEFQISDIVIAPVLLVLTIGLSSLDFLQKRLEPTERWRIATDPEELDTLEGTKRALLLAVPNVLENGRERRDTLAKCVSSAHNTTI